MTKGRAIGLVLAAGIGLAACGGGSSSPAPLRPTATPAPGPTPTSRSIGHVVIAIQENRTFDNFFSTFPGADGTTTGKTSNGRTVTLAKTNLAGERDLTHSYQGFVIARDGGKMDGFDRVPFGNGMPEGTYPYRYVDPAQIQPYWTLAKRYALADHMFQTQGSSSFTAHQDLIAGGTEIAPDRSLVNLPSGSPWGCDAPAGTRTSLVTENGQLLAGQGPFPCLTYATLRDLLDAKHVSWKYYVPPMCCTVFGKLMSAFDAIKAVRYSSEWTTNVSSPQQNIFKDLSKGKLAAVSWLIPDEPDSDHPGTTTDTGPSWIAQVVNAVGQSRYWNSTAVIIVWDDWGGLYDHVAPQQLGYGGLGFRVPMLVVSPYARTGYVSHTQYEFGSILKFVEDNWDLGRLGTTDVRANSIADVFDFTRPPSKFAPIPAKYSKSYFLHERPSYLPVDTDM